MSKKTVDQIAQQQQHYLIALKANQLKLYRTLVQLHQTSACLSQAQTFDTSHNCQVHRRVSVYAAPTLLERQWSGLNTLIWVERWGVRDGQSFEEQIGYISDLELTAIQFLQHIQQHWHIENRLHWVRDVAFDEDHARPGGNAPVIWAILNRVGDVFPAALRRSLGIAIRIWHSGAKRFPYPVRLRRGRLISDEYRASISLPYHPSRSACSYQSGQASL